MWTGLRSLNTNRASGAAMARILILPWLVWAALWTGIIIFDELNRGPLPRWLKDEDAGVVSWLIIGLVINVLFGSWAYRNLTENFRESVAARFDKRRKRWFGKSPDVSVPKVAAAPQAVASDA
jgi:hypothetical protein